MDNVKTYTQRITRLEEDFLILKRRKNTISWIRFIITIVAAVVTWRLKDNGWLFVALPIVIWLAVFLRLVVLAVKNNAAIAHHQRLVAINQQEIEIAKGNYANLPDGSQFNLPVHDYANDLDIFGRASIYQYINRTTSEQGNKFLAGKLLHPSEVNDIHHVQEAAKELSPAYEWRQELQAHGMESPITITTQEKIATWLREPFAYSGNKGWQLMRIIFPVISLSTLLLHIIGIMSSPVFYALVILYLLISGGITKTVTAQYLSLNKIVGQVTTLSNSLETIEKLAPKTPLLQTIKAAFVGATSQSSTEVKRLKSILDRFDIRLNPLVFLPLNAFLLWDLQLIFQLEKWKQKNQSNVNNWFDKLGQIEFLNTIANLHFNQPQWVFASFVEQHGHLAATDLGHPLIEKNKRVDSNFEIHGTPQLALITGSNMAGKSTFLRSVGTNVVLAMMGAPVCASSFELSPMRVISTMRIGDNLEESTSTFYAELKKLQYIIEAVNRKEKVFLLFDEILRGTNSADRHLGSAALIRQLMHHDAVGILATHDLELTKLTGEFPQAIRNYHFDMQLKNGSELFFDYKLKDGICESMNAAILMKMIGIEFN
ncbi:MutS family DNA mismatch repair protein [Chitinophagaceae bacterium 26-R-25]|nr:MutS family DNA mismatch repair protein [Chitinophagaceae bacterium 26-R-25]